MRLDCKLHALIVVGSLYCTADIASAQTQPADQALPPANPTGWTFNIAPYLWLPQINTTLDYNLPAGLGGRLPTDVSVGPGEYLPKLKFATAFAADAQYGPFSLLTDFMYMSLGNGRSHIRSVDFLGLPSQPISSTVDRGTSSTLKTTLWTLAGGYTVFQGDWGNFDVLAGFRYLGVNSDTNFNLALTITGPLGNGATFGGVGGISGRGDIWNGIAGFRGRVRLADTGFFIPYYFDIGAGGSNLTWQIASGVGYQTGWAGVSATYRYLSFEQGSSAVVRHLTLGGPMIAVNFSF